jgi:hypothetical protein
VLHARFLGFDSFSNCHPLLGFMGLWLDHTRQGTGGYPIAYAHVPSINLICDSQNTTCLIKDQMFHERTKHIVVKYHYVRDIVAQDKLNVCKIS